LLFLTKGFNSPTSRRNMKKYISTIVIVLGILIFPSFSFADTIIFNALDNDGAESNSTISTGSGRVCTALNFTPGESTTGGTIEYQVWGNGYGTTVSADLTARLYNSSQSFLAVSAPLAVNAGDSWYDFVFPETIMSENSQYFIAIDISGNANTFWRPYYDNEVDYGSTNGIGYSGTSGCNNGFTSDGSHGGIFWTSLVADTTNNSFNASSTAYNFSSPTSTPGFNFNATSSEGWINSIWNTSSSAFYVDCSGNDGGFFTSSTLNAIGCQAQRVGMGLLGMFISPLPFINNYMTATISRIQTVFPFSMVFSAQNVIENQLASSSSENAGTLSFNTNTPIGSITVLTSSTLENAIGSSTKNQVFDAIEFLIWLGAGVIIITLI